MTEKNDVCKNFNRIALARTLFIHSLIVRTLSHPFISWSHFPLAVQLHVKMFIVYSNTEQSIDHIRIYFAGEMIECRTASDREQ